MWKNRKQSTRLLSPSQQRDLVVLPRMHATLLLNGTYDIQYLHTLIGTFNIAIAIANLHRRESAELELNRVQDMMANLVALERLPEGDERGLILAAVDASERLILGEARKNLLKVLDYIDRRIAAGMAQTPTQRNADNQARQSATG